MTVGVSALFLRGKPGQRVLVLSGCPVRLSNVQSGNILERTHTPRVRKDSGPDAVLPHRALPKDRTIEGGHDERGAAISTPGDTDRAARTHYVPVIKQFDKPPDSLHIRIVDRPRGRHTDGEQELTIGGEQTE
ncbi:hypothetical protein ACFW6C_04665 [Streptomyces fungicidicus]|uniref:hypothetical protein n=1 Tax=Streptomyces fungicidicus TaxID=68203 RepID=UPI00332DCB72